ncbi:MAG: thioredoxin family protein [Desulfobacterales bacterium]|nr:thioredoxin family protein [Desulfobacterales bacterium]
MDKVLVQERVYTLLNDHYIPIKINLDNEKPLARKYQVNGIPALLFLDNQGKLIERINGYVPMDNLVAILKKIG